MKKMKSEKKKRQEFGILQYIFRNREKNSLISLGFSQFIYFASSSRLWPKEDEVQGFQPADSSTGIQNVPPAAFLLEEQRQNKKSELGKYLEPAVRATVGPRQCAG